LTISGSTLYSTTRTGGDDDGGTVFAVNTDGTGFRLLHEFAGGDQGAFPTGNLTLSGSTLFGTTGLNGGIIYSVNTDGSGFRILHDFAGGADDGYNPEGGVTLNNSTLYGTTHNGGDAEEGTIFSMNTDGTDFQLLHEFGDGAADGRGPASGLSLSGSTLYGTTTSGGEHGRGTIFSINTDGTDYTLLREFAGGPNDGNRPRDLTLSGTTLFGVTFFGGEYNYGTLYSVNTDGSGFELLHDFNVSGLNGADPNRVIVVNSTLFGTTAGGGGHGQGTAYSLNTDGTGFTILRSFAYPFPVPEPSALVLLLAGLGVLLLLGRCPAPRRRAIAEG
jgi:uncharacterized repeat protein (TIGR03803 family)